MDFNLKRLSGLLLFSILFLVCSSCTGFHFEGEREAPPLEPFPTHQGTLVPNKDIEISPAEVSTPEEDTLPAQNQGEGEFAGSQHFPHQVLVCLNEQSIHSLVLFFYPVDKNKKVCTLQTYIKEYDSASGKYHLSEPSLDGFTNDECFKPAQATVKAREEEGWRCADQPPEMFVIYI